MYCVSHMCTAFHKNIKDESTFTVYYEIVTHSCQHTDRL